MILLWATEPLHHLSPALVALLGAVAAVTPGIGCLTFPAAIKRVPWSLCCSSRPPSRWRPRSPPRALPRG
ncbi:hypothetical protein JM654_22210 [Microbacterium oxydans]|nr:hypothetical protein [Microbacterium oxydans]